MGRNRWPDLREETQSARGRRRSAMLVSAAVHVVLLVAVYYAVHTPLVMDRFLRFERMEPAPRERTEFVTLAPAVSPAAPARTPARPRAGAPVAEPVPPIEAPTEVPTTLPPPRADSVPPRATAGAAVGPAAGGAGPTRGVQPTFEDPRVWTPDPPLVYAPKTSEERLDSALTTSLARYQDSLARYSYSPNKFERGDWTYEKDGRKYGIDQNYIRLGRFSIPTALLALLPLNRMQVNPIAAERERGMAAMRADIVYHAQVQLNEDEFRRAVRAIRDRKERDRTRFQPRKGEPPPTVSPGEKPPR